TAKDLVVLFGRNVTIVQERQDSNTPFVGSRWHRQSHRHDSFQSRWSAFLTFAFWTRAAGAPSLPRARGAVRESPLDQVGPCNPHSRRRRESAPAGRRRTWQATEGDTQAPREIYQACCRMTGKAPRDRAAA